MSALLWYLIGTAAGVWLNRAWVRTVVPLRARRRLRAEWICPACQGVFVYPEHPKQEAVHVAGMWHCVHRQQRS